MQTNTYTKSLIEKAGFQVFTYDNMLTPILRFDLFDRLAEPGFSPINRFIETTLDPISTSVRVAQLTFKELLSRDSIEMLVNTTILYKFDPRGCLRHIIAQFVRADNAVFEAIIQDYVGQALLQLVSRYRAAELKEAFIQNQIKQLLLRTVNADMAILGLSIPNASCVIFKAFTPHAQYLQTMLENVNLDEKMQLLSLLDEKTVQKFVQTAVFDALKNMPEGSTVFADMSGGSFFSGLAGANGLFNGRFPDKPTPQPNPPQPLRPNGRPKA